MRQERPLPAAIRAQRPGTLLVEDAHRHLRLLTDLRRIRREIHAKFRIVADCWPGEREAVARALDVASAAVRHLKPLPRLQIVEVIHGCGIGGPPVLVREIMAQAGGRPGLAVTLFRMCLRDGVEKIALADALCSDVTTTFEGLVGDEAVAALAAFAVGGESGMPMPEVAGELRLSLARIQRVATHLAAGGVLSEVGPQVLAVWPEPLRHWVKKAMPGSAGYIERRRVSARAAVDWLRSNRPAGPAVAVAAVALAPDFLHPEEAPGDDGLTLRHGWGSPDELVSIGELWPGLLEVLPGVPVEAWQPDRGVSGARLEAAPLGLSRRSADPVGSSNGRPLHRRVTSPAGLPGLGVRWRDSAPGFRPHRRASPAGGSSAAFPAPQEPAGRRPGRCLRVARRADRPDPTRTRRRLAYSLRAGR